MLGKSGAIVIAVAAGLIAGVVMPAPASAVQPATILNIAASASATVIEPEGGGVTIATRGRVVGTPILQVRDLLAGDNNGWVTASRMTKRGKIWAVEAPNLAPGDYLYRVLAKSGTKVVGVSHPMSVKKYGWFPSAVAGYGMIDDFAGTALPSRHGTPYQGNTREIAAAACACVALDLGIKDGLPPFGDTGSVTVTVTSDGALPLVVTANAANHVILMTGLPVSGRVVVTERPITGVSVHIGERLKCLGDPAMYTS